MSEQLRQEYRQATLDERSVDPDPFRQFAEWLKQAQDAKLYEPTAMVLTTAGRGGRPGARVVLLKGFDENGFVFYTDHRSRKAWELAENPQAGLLFYWPELERQVRIQGVTDRVSRELSEAYFRTRPRGSQLGAWASQQSAVLPGGREELEAKVAEVKRTFGDGDVPLPPHWGGYLLTPDEFEFWQGRENRLHDRIRFVRSEDGWAIERLSP